MGVASISEFEIHVCTQRRFAPNLGGCGTSGSEQLFNEIVKKLTATGSTVKVKQVGCMLLCEHGPNIKLSSNPSPIVSPKKIWHKANISDVNEIVRYCINL